jgi:L-alanine-DL-glutamate epimerase-like enolase superfamily enzyme
MRIEGFRLTRFQYRRDRVIGDSQVRIDQSHTCTIELIADSGQTGLGFMLSLFNPLPALVEIERIFRQEIWPAIEGEAPAAYVHRQHRPRGGNIRAPSLAFGEGINQAMWDLAAQQAGLPLWRLLGGTSPRVRAYASGLDFNLSDADYSALFAQAAALGFSAFKIKVGHPDVAWDLNRLALLRKAVGAQATIMVDANEAWTPKETLRRLDIYRRAGFDIFWVEDPCLRDDFAGLREIRAACRSTHVNSGEYLDLHGKRMLLEARGADILNVHGNISDVLQAAWLAGDHGVEISLGNTMLELGVHLGAAIPEARWLEYSFQNYNHLVEQPIRFVDGHAIAPDRPGHGLVLSEAARRDHAAPDILPPDALPPAPASSPIRL